MNPSTSKTDDALDESGEQLLDAYCKDVIPSLIHSATDYYMTKQIRQELEIERLTRANADIDEEIAEKLKKFKESKNISAKLDIDLYNQTQMEEQTKARYGFTGDILNILSDETKKIKNHAEHLEAKRIEITKRIQGFGEQKKRNDEMKNKIEDLNKQVKDLLDEPEPTLDENLPKRNEELRMRVQQQRKALEIKRMKKGRIEELKKPKIDLLMKINEKQEEKQMKCEKVEIIKTNMIKVKEEVDQKQAIVEKISIEQLKLLQKVTDSKTRCDQKSLKMKEQTERIAQKENELKILKKKCATRQESINKEREKKEQEYEILKSILMEWDKKMTVQMEQHALNKIILKEKTQELLNLQFSKEDLTKSIYETKIQVLTRQFDSRKEQNSYMEGKLHSEKEDVEKLKIRLEELLTIQKEADKKLDEYPQELEARREKMQQQHKEQIEVIFKRQKVYTALIEVDQHFLDITLKEVADLSKEIKDIKGKTELDETVINRRKFTLKTISERAKREEQEIEKITEQLKPREQQSFKTIEEIEFKAGRSAASLKGYSGILKGRAAIKALQQVSERMDEVETIENEETEPSSGRKSPGILKKSHTALKRVQMPPRRVTFEGVSSESSSQSLDMNQGENKNGDDESFLEELKKIGPILRKPPMEF